MAALTIREVVEAGGYVGTNAASFAAATSGGDTIAGSSVRAGGWSNSDVVLVVRNAHATDPRTVTCGGVASIVPGLGIGFINVAPEGRNDASVAVTYSDSAADLTVCVIRTGSLY